ncbi:phosphopyruvate hydratase [Nitrososphaera viennensis]|uniref:Enolase n=2 Tax=Nitrososphaera viennensis TaxID=1034015 RepID=A0A060HIS3_9ARCH|nr:enolase C-terminal domain-like protein [Nitrososphaera viennensis]AIC15413.1 enolase [Nitrososphaera viennensis EN76]UVS70307.1 enolase [Nitrososphaera viennensis]
MPSSITALDARIVFNSRGSKTIEVDVVTDKKFSGRACAPSGASVGKLEAQSFPDNKPEKALAAFNANRRKFIGLDASDTKAVFDALRKIDKTDNYSKIGGSVAYALSIAAVDSAAKAKGVPLFRLLNPKKPYRFPFPLGNVLGGGAHAGPGTPDIQEILACPVGAKGIMEALEMNFRFHSEMRKVIESTDSRFTYGRGDEGAWAPSVNNDQALEIAEKTIEKCGYRLGKDMALGIDFASSSFWDEKNSVYDYARQGVKRDTGEQIEFANRLIRDYKLAYAEDPVHEADFESMAVLTKKNPQTLVTGDDMLVTNAGMVKKAVEFGACSGAILKVNQAGSLYDALQFARECTKNGIGIITSHRSGESVDSHIAHIAVATGSKMIKTGVVGGERIAKLNELVRLSEYDLIEGMAELTPTT